MFPLEGNFSRAIRKFDKPRLQHHVCVAPQTSVERDSYTGLHRGTGLGSVVGEARAILRRNKMNDASCVRCLKTNPRSYFGIALAAEMMAGSTTPLVQADERGVSRGRGCVWSLACLSLSLGLATASVVVREHALNGQRMRLCWNEILWIMLPSAKQAAPSSNPWLSSPSPCRIRIPHASSGEAVETCSPICFFPHPRALLNKLRRISTESST